MEKDSQSGENVRSKGVDAALRLLEREPDPLYISRWTTLLAKPKEDLQVKEASVIIFRLNQEWLAINSNVFSEVLSYRNVHRIPHRTNQVLLGIINYQGVLRLCLNMHHFLMIDPEEESVESFSRMVCIEKEEEQWIFPVDEVFGVFHVDLKQLQSPPITVAKSKASYLRGIIDWNGKNVAYLDEELLFFGLKKVIL